MQDLRKKMRFIQKKFASKIGGFYLCANLFFITAKIKALTWKHTL